jgi:hypothetical protein
MPPYPDFASSRELGVGFERTRVPAFRRTELSTCMWMGFGSSRTSSSTSPVKCGPKLERGRKSVRDAISRHIDPTHTRRRSSSRDDPRRAEHRVLL